jgi:hypothetical protein
MSSAVLTNQSDSEVYTFPKTINYMSLHPEGEGKRIEGEYVISVDGNGDYVAGGKIVKFLSTTPVGKKITIAGTMSETETEKLNEWWEEAALLRLEAQTGKKTHDYIVQMSEPKWTSLNKNVKDESGDLKIQYTIDFWIQYVEV